MKEGVKLIFKSFLINFNVNHHKIMIIKTLFKYGNTRIFIGLIEF